MFGINEILNKAILNEKLTLEEKFNILRSKRIDTTVVEYLMNKLNNLYIEVLGKYEGSLFELMPVGKLEGWCWQTTESAIVFLNDNDYIERGNLRFDERAPEYYHSWICFKFNNIEYILDPCLNFLCEKKDYFKIFEIKVKGKVTAKAVREELIRQITNAQEENNLELNKAAIQSFLEKFMGESYDSYVDRKKGEVTVCGSEDVNTPLYRNGAGYKVKINNEKIKKMTVHYYYSDC